MSIFNNEFKNSPLNNIPLEMRDFRSWVVWRFEDRSSVKPTKIPYCALSGKLASVTNPSTWCDFEAAVSVLNSSSRYDGIGFVLSSTDPYCFIDLDSPKSQENFNRQFKISEAFPSYQEYSPSGNGLHIIVRASVPSGRKRDSIEIYSDLRYMTMTGNVYKSTAIQESNELANNLWEELGNGPNKTQFYMGMSEEEYTDNEIIEMASNATNGELFDRLWSGDWSDYKPNEAGTHSSEADMALVDIIAFYSHNKAQISRLFLKSGLGKRDKAKRTGYIEYMLNKCFDNILPPVDIEGLQNKLNEIIEDKARESFNKSQLEYVEEETSDGVEYESASDVYSVPPGLLGELAKYIYASSHRPVPEIAIAASIGLMCGITGRAYNVSGTGLNQYVMMVADTGRGKETLHQGIDRVMKNVINTVPAAAEFIGPGEIASPQAIMKFMSKGPKSFLTLSGEIGMRLSEMTGRNVPAHLHGIRRFILDAYGKSGHDSYMKPLIYSDKDKNTDPIQSPAFSILGDTTPGNLYENLNQDLIAEGLLPRFTIIEYLGPRVPKNEKHYLVKPDMALIDKLAQLCTSCLMLNNQNEVINVDFTPEAQKLTDEYDKYCDEKINSSRGNVQTELWNRGHLKVLKLAALIAVGINPYDPVIDTAAANWAIKVIEKDISIFSSRFDRGEVGNSNGEEGQIKTLSKCIHDYINSKPKDIEAYANKIKQLHRERVIPYSYISKKLSSCVIFKNDRYGATGSIKRAIGTLVERGDLEQLKKSVVSSRFDTTAICYMISNPGAFGF